MNIFTPLPLFLVSTVATAGSLVTPVPTGPTVDDVIDAYATSCAYEPADIPVSATYEGVAGSCNVLIDRDLGSLNMVLDAPDLEASGSKPSPTVLDARVAEDVAMLTGLGFDPSEFGAVNATTLMAFVDDDATPRALATKTFIDRVYVDAYVPTNRIVVTRSLDGSIQSLSFKWPVIAPDASLEDLVDPTHPAESVMSDAGDAARVLGIRKILIVDLVVDGAIQAGRVVEEAILQPRADGEKIQGQLVANGALIES